MNNRVRPKSLCYFQPHVCINLCKVKKEPFFQSEVIRFLLGLTRFCMSKVLWPTKELMMRVTSRFCNFDFISIGCRRRSDFIFLLLKCWVLSFNILKIILILLRRNFLFTILIYLTLGEISQKLKSNNQFQVRSKSI